jgi:hypothetical protein
MATKNANPEDLNWFKRAAKRHADELCFRAMGPWVTKAPRKQVRSVLSLPAGNWLWERMLADVFPQHRFLFNGIEQNEKVFDVVQSMGVKLNQLYDNHTFRSFERPISFSDYVKIWSESRAVSFDMIYLDWMGTWGRDKCDQIDQIFNEDMLAEDSLLRITIGLNRGNPKSWSELSEVEYADFHIVDIRGGGSPLPKWKVHGIPALIEAIGSDYGRTVRLVTAHAYSSYHDGNRSAVPEISFLFRVR